LAVVARTDDLAGEFVFDVDEDGRIIGIEVLDATTVLRPETIAQLQRLGTPWLPIEHSHDCSRAGNMCAGDHFNFA
jgi:hypothetical protein